MTDEQFFDFCQENSDLIIERNQYGEISIMPPTGSEGGNREGRLIQQVMNWTDEDAMRLGINFQAVYRFYVQLISRLHQHLQKWLFQTKYDKLVGEIPI